MADTAYLASTVVMGLLGVGVLVFVVRGRQWHQYAPTLASGGRGGGGPTSGIARLAGRTSTWTALYVALVLSALGGAYAYTSGALDGTGMIAALGGLLALYLVVGVYFGLREHGRPYSQATAGSAVTLGALVLAAIVAKLVFGI